MLNWWLPENVATFGEDIDWLFHLIYAITGITFETAGLADDVAHGAERNERRERLVVPEIVLAERAAADDQRGCRDRGIGPDDTRASGKHRSGSRRGEATHAIEWA